MRLALLLSGFALSVHPECPAQLSRPLELHVTAQPPDVRGLYVSSYGLH